MELYLLILYFLSAALTGMLCTHRTIGFAGGYFLSLLLSPLLGLLIGFATGREEAAVFVPAQAHTLQRDVYLQLERLADMKSKGVLSDEEFRREKNRILAA